MATKKEFIAKILEIGKGKSINKSEITREVPAILPPLQWWYDGASGSLGIRNDGYYIRIGNGREPNPPQNEEAITFSRKTTTGTKEEVDTIPNDFADAAVLTLYTKPSQPFAKIESVILPYSIKQAIHGLQLDTDDIEYGGGIDFEIIKGQPQVERLLAYFAEKDQVPSRVLRKYGRDVEVLFHTHPSYDLAVPSIDDISSFISNKQQMEFIAAGKEILILEKTRNTPKQITENEVRRKLQDKWHQPQSKSEQSKMLKEAEQNFKLRTTLIPYSKERTLLDINVIRTI